MIATDLIRHAVIRHVPSPLLFLTGAALTIITCFVLFPDRFGWDNMREPIFVCLAVPSVAIAAVFASRRAEASVEALAVGMASFQPLPRAGLSEDVAKSVLFLASDQSSFVTGIDIVVDSASSPDVVRPKLRSPARG